MELNQERKYENFDCFDVTSSRFNSRQTLSLVDITPQVKMQNPINITAQNYEYLKKNRQT